MLEDGLAYWADVIVDAIHRVVPTSVVTMGFFHAHEPNPARHGDPRLVYTNEFVQRSRVSTGRTVRASQMTLVWRELGRLGPRVVRSV
jgi:hypothetical protein